MPIFDYKCSACGEEFESLVFGARVPACPGCGSEDVAKKLSVFGMSGVEKPFAGSDSCSKSTCGKSSCSSCK